MTNFLLIPGAWMGAWVWELVTGGLRALGHHVHSVTLSGLSRDADISDVRLVTHVDDVLSILEAKDPRDGRRPREPETRTLHAHYCLTRRFSGAC